MIMLSGAIWRCRIPSSTSSRVAVTFAASRQIRDALAAVPNRAAVVPELEVGEGDNHTSKSIDDVRFQCTINDRVPERPRRAAHTHGRALRFDARTNQIRHRELRVVREGG